MNTTALLLVILGALVHASWNVLAKKASGGTAFVWLYGAVSVLLAAPVGVYAWLTGVQPMGWAAWAAIGGSALAHLAYSLVLQKGYQASDFSIVYPLARGTGPLLTVLAATLLLGEAPSPSGWVGIGAILAGILLVSDVQAGFSTHPGRARAGALWGVLTGATIAVYTVVDGWAVKALGLAPILYYVLGLLLRTVILAPRALRDLPALQRQWKLNARYIVGVGALAPLAYTLVLYAMKTAPLVYVAPARELSMLIGVMLGARLLRESLSPGRIAGTVLMVAGVALLALARAG